MELSNLHLKYRSCFAIVFALALIQSPQARGEGACDLGDGLCMITSAEICRTMAGGEFLGESTDCDAIPNGDGAVDNEPPVPDESFDDDEGLGDFVAAVERADALCGAIGMVMIASCCMGMLLMPGAKRRRSGTSPR